MMVKCMRCRKLLLESKMHKLMRFHNITPGANFNQIQAELKYIIEHNIGKRFMGYMMILKLMHCSVFMEIELMY
jgi:hypothetical protein